MTKRSDILVQPLHPTLKERQRYMVYETNTPLNPARVLQAIQTNLGVIEQARAGLQHIDYDKSNNRGILRVTNAMTDTVRIALILNQSIHNTQVQPRVVGMSGTIANAREKYMEAR